MKDYLTIAAMAVVVMALLNNHRYGYGCQGSCSFNWQKI